MNTKLERDFQFLDGYAAFRPTGRVSFDEAVITIADALSYAMSQRVNRLLVDTTGLTGFPSPSVWERFWMASEWAAVAHSAVRLAVVARPELIDPDRFGVTVARNRGLFANVFSAEPEAIEWLLNPHPK